jgi:hypothetical protein
LEDSIPKESLAVLLKELYFGPAPELELEIIDRALPWIKGRVKWVRVCFEVVAKFLCHYNLNHCTIIARLHLGESSSTFKRFKGRRH